MGDRANHKIFGSTSVRNPLAGYDGPLVVPSMYTPFYYLRYFEWAATDGVLNSVYT